MKKKLCMVLSAMLIMTSTNLAFAEEKKFANNKDLIFTESKSEFDSYKKLQAYELDELIEMGISEKDACAIKETSFEEIVLERASLPEVTLKNMGYSSKDIEVLKAYKGEELTESSEVVTRASAVCTGTLTKVSSSGSGNNKKIEFRYNWSWDKSPLVTSGDSASVLWTACNTAGTIKASDFETSKATVTYKDYATGTEVTKNKTTYPEYAVSTSAVLVATDFDVRIDHNSTGGKWAKSGTLKVTVIPEGTYELHALDIQAAVGHSTVTGNISADISSSGASISFSPSFNVERVGETSKRIRF